MLPLELARPSKDVDEIIDMPITFGSTEEYISPVAEEEEKEETVIVMMEDELLDGIINTGKNLIECSASVVLPFSEDVAFDAFSDLTRQP